MAQQIGGASFGLLLHEPSSGQQPRAYSSQNFQFFSDEANILKPSCVDHGQWVLNHSDLTRE